MRIGRFARALQLWSLGLLLAAAGCHGHRTLLFLQLQAGAGAPADVRSIDVQLTLAGRSTSITLREKQNTAIAFPTGDILDIGSGAGALTALAIARDGSGGELARANGSATIIAGESSALTLVFGMPTGDDGGAPPDLSTPSDAAPTAGDMTVTADLLDAAAPPPDLTTAIDLATPADLGATVPGAPTNVTAVAQVLSAKVDWVAPASNGGAPIVAYTVTSRPDGVQAVVYPPAPLSAIVNGLRQGGSYTFTVTATNGVGTGPPSAASTTAVVPSNLALTATATASSTFSGYSAANVIDGNIDATLGPAYSWANNMSTPLPQWLQLDFGATSHTPTVVHLYTTLGYEMQAFNVQVSHDNFATSTTVATVSGNSATYVNVPLTPVAGTALRVYCTLGSVAQNGYVRINELEVY